MKKRIFLFTNSLLPTAKANDNSLSDNLRAVGLDEYERIYYSDVIISLNGKNIKCFYEKKGEILPLELDLAFFRGLADTDTRQFLARYFKDNKTKVINTENIYNMPTSKLNQYYAFARHKVPYPQTVCAYPKLLIKSIDLANLSYPVIVKSVDGKKGDDNYLVKNRKELEKLVVKLDPLQVFATQPFIYNDGDYRLIVCKNKILICYKRIRNDLQKDYRNNVGQGGSRVLVTDLPKQYQKTAIVAARALKREITGVDLLVGPDKKPYFLESNFKFGLKDTGDEIFDLVIKRLAPILHKLAK